MDRTAVEWLVDAVLRALALGERLPPAGLLLLVREYAATGRAEVADALGPALAHGLAVSGSFDESGRRVDWIHLFIEGAICSEDERLLATAAALVADLVGEWPSRGRVAPAMRSISACLALVQVAENTDEGAELLGSTIDELERVIGFAYAPGEGVAGVVGELTEQGGLSDHVEAAAALLRAYECTARLPYSMLAEELMQFARRRWWDAPHGCFTEPAFARSTLDELRRGKAETTTADALRSGTLETMTPEPSRPAGVEEFKTNCAAVRVFCRMAALHRDDDYRQAAVIASGSDYALDSETILTSLGSAYRTYNLDAATYGIALGEYLALGQGQ